MTGFTALMRSLRKPALALVASAGLVAWGSAGAPATRVAAAAGQEVLAAGSHLRTAALGQSGAAAGLFAETAERQQGRTAPGGSGSASGPTPPRPLSVLDGAAATRTPAGSQPHARSGRENAPSTGPPSVPS